MGSVLEISAGGSILPASRTGRPGDAVLPSSAFDADCAPNRDSGCVVPNNERTSGLCSALASLVAAVVVAHAASARATRGELAGSCLISTPNWGATCSLFFDSAGLTSVRGGIPCESDEGIPKSGGC